MGLLCIIYTSFVVAISQSGPSWEVPQSVMLYLSLLPIVVLIGVIVVYKSIKLKSQISKNSQLKWHIIAISSLSVIFPIITSLIDIEQWPINSPTISAFLRFYFLPIILFTSVFELVYLMKIINKK